MDEDEIKDFFKGHDFEDRVLYYIVNLIGDRPVGYENAITEIDIAHQMAKELNTTPDFINSGDFHASRERMQILEAVQELEKGGYVDSLAVFGPWTIRPTQSGRRYVTKWREDFDRKKQEITENTQSTATHFREAQEAWIEVARLRRELQFTQRNSSQAATVAEKTIPIQLFFSYAHEDQALRDELEKHLASLKNQRLIVGWHDRDINAGKEWQHEIDMKLQSSQIILLLVSPDFMNSDYCYGTEMMRAMARHEANEAIVIPIILRPVDWEDAPFSKLQALPTEGKPVTSWLNRDEAFLGIAKNLRKVVMDILVRGRIPQIDSVTPETRSMIFPANASPDFKILTPPTFQENQPHWIDVNAIEQAITIKNIGKENAYDICAVLFGCETYIVTQTMPQKRMNGTDGIHWREISHCPIEPGETLPLALQQRRDILDGVQRIGQYTLYAPHEPGLDAMMHNLDVPFSSARLTLTYRDFSRQRYTQTFDYYHYKNGWAYLSHPERISVDLRDILA